MESVILLGFVQRGVERGGDDMMAFSEKVRKHNRL